MKRPMYSSIIVAIITLVFFSAVAAVHAVAAEASDCYVISDPDRRAMCLAKAHKDSGRCYSIQRQDLRAECQAETRK